MNKLEEVKADPYPRIFYLAGKKGWYMQTGHQLSVRGHRFAVIPTEGGRVEISEVSTGMLFYKLPIDLNVLDATDTKEGTLEFIKDVLGPIVRERIKKIKGFNKMIEKQRTRIQLKLGKKPKNKIFESLDDMKFYLEGMKQK